MSVRIFWQVAAVPRVIRAAKIFGFPHVIAHSLVRRSEQTGISINVQDRRDVSMQLQEKLDRESLTTNNGTDVKDRPNVNVAPFNATRLRDTDNVINDAQNNEVAQEYATSYVDTDSGFNIDGQASALKIDPLRRWPSKCIENRSVEAVLCKWCTI